MSNHYTIISNGISNANDKCLLGIYNGVGSGRILRVYRVGRLNNQTVSVTGAVGYYSLTRLSSGSGGTPVISMKHDSSSENLPPQIITSYAMNFTKDVDIFNFTRFTDEPLFVTVSPSKTLQTMHHWSVIYEHPFGLINTTVEPITLREGYGLGIIHNYSYTLSTNTLVTPVGVADYFIEFTSETS